MSASLQIDIQSESDCIRMRLRGSLVESSVIDYADPNVQELIIDLHELRRVNSAGAQAWVKWTRSYFPGKKVKLERIPTIFVLLASIIDDMIPADVEIVSFYVPYSDESGEQCEDILFERGKQFSETELLLPPHVRGPISGQPLKIDVHPVKYFNFLKRRYPRLTVV